ncbi:hypothetical protein ACOI1C_04360 [Bacillus sp. DJP31]|uniref:hypothetical protein n=1 Tax=Bacillus sp. DJP31 TaxID=3409789 RepID=UPI003BB53C08
MLRYKFKFLAILFLFVVEILSSVALDSIFKMGIIDSMAIISLLFFGLILFFSSSGDAMTNRNIASAMMALLPTGHQEKRPKPEISLNPLLIGAFLFFLISLLASLLSYWFF